MRKALGKGIRAIIPEETQAAMAAEARPIRIYRFALERFSFPDACFFLSCSKGTYVRALCDSIGERLGFPAVLSALVRTRVGAMTLDKALDETTLKSLSMSEIEKNLIRGPLSQSTVTVLGAVQ